MSSLRNNLFEGGILIQKGVRKVYHKDKQNRDKCIEYVNNFTLDATNRDNYYIDSSGVDNFFQIYFDDDRYILYQYDKFGKSFEVDSISLEEINKGYIKLSDFLRNANYVGKKFRRTAPLITYYGTDEVKYRMKDNSYLDVDDYENIVLYSMDNIFLVKCISCFGEIYKIIGCNYIIDGNYEFYGDIYEEYNNRDKIYLEIVKQIDDWSKKLNKMRVKKNNY